MTIAATLKQYLDAQGAHFELPPHPTTYSSRDGAAAAHVPGDHIAKAVVVQDEDGCAMVAIPGDHWLKLDALKRETNRPFELASEPDLRDLFPDCAPGAIPPVGPAYAMETLVDEALTTLANVHFEAGDHRHLVHVDAETFHLMLGGARHGRFSHDD